MSEYEEGGGKLSKKETEEILKECKTEFTRDEADWSEIRREGDIDIRYSTGDTWDDADRAMREGRLMLCMDETGQYTNQVVNESRMNKRSVQVTATGYGGNDKLAKYRAERIRQIEWRSNAQQAYTSLIENAVLRSFGWLRITLEWVKGTFDRELFIRSIPNPNLVIPGPHVMPDGSDLKRLWFIENRTHPEFLREFPRAEVRSFPTDLQTNSGGWVRSTDLQVAEYWRTKVVSKTLLRLQIGQQTKDIYEDALEEWLEKSQIRKGQYKPVDKREEDVPTVCQYVTNGVEILSKTEWPEPDIPFVPCYGPVYFVNKPGGTQREIHSMLRKARHAAKMLNYTWSTEGEVIQKTPKIPWMVRRGSLVPDELAMLAKSDYEQVAVIQVETMLPEGGMNGAPPEMPERGMYEPPIQALEFAKESARRAIQAAMAVSPLPTQAQKRNEKSGVALEHMEDSAAKGSYHFYDHQQDAIMRTGLLLSNLIPHIDDVAKDVTLRDQADKPKQVRINDPSWVNPESNQPEHIDVAGGGLFDVTIGTGPRQDSERTAASEFADALVGGPQLAQVLGPEKYSEILALAIKMKNVGPYGDQIAEIISPTEDEGGNDPRKLKEQNQQLMQAAQMLEKHVQELSETVKTDKVKIQEKGKVDAAMKRIEMDGQADLQLALQVMKDATSIRIAEINASVKGYTVEAQHAAEHESQALGHAVEMQGADADRAHEAQMAAMQHQQGLEAGGVEHQQELESGDVEHQQALEQGQVGHQQAIEQGELGHEQALEQGAQAAALAPQPEAE